MKRITRVCALVLLAAVVGLGFTHSAAEASWKQCCRKCGVTHHRHVYPHVSPSRVSMSCSRGTIISTNGPTPCAPERLSSKTKRVSCTS